MPTTTTNGSRRHLAALQDERLTRLATERLELFLQCVWPILEPGHPYCSNWHIGLLSEYLEAVTAGEITRLVINMPPRYGKSIVTSVVWPVWEWLQRPSSRWLFVSYSDALAARLSLDRRRLLQASWFRERYPRIRLAHDQAAKTEFHNTRRGAMVAMSMQGSITGKGGQRLVIDDPHTPEQAESDLQRAQAVDRFRQTLSTRLDDKTHGAIVVVAQRLHVRDLSGVCLEMGFTHLKLEAVAPRRTVIVFPRTHREHTREAGEALWPARENLDALDRQKRIIGAHAHAAQYQQEPVLREGGLFPRGWWNDFHELPLGDDFQIIQSWDLSFKKTDQSDYVVGLVAARRGAEVYLLDRYKAKASFTETVTAIRTMCAKYPSTQAVLVEEAANGSAVVDLLKAAIPGLVAVHPEGGKEARAHAVQPLLEARQVFLPNPISLAGYLRPERAWVEDFVTTCEAFPKAAHDDDVDALTQLLVWCRTHAAITPCSSLLTPDPEAERLDRLARRDAARASQFERARRFCQW